MLTFNKPYLTGKEVHYIYQAVNAKKTIRKWCIYKKMSKFF